VRPSRRGREEKKASTRAAILQAAGRVFAREGYRGASLEQVADEAGFTKGAVYSNFSSKEQLFLLLLEREEARRQAELVMVVAAASDIDAKAAAAGHWAADVVDEQRQWCLLFIEFWSHAVRDDRLRPRLAELYAQWRRTVAELMQLEAQRLNLILPLSAEDLATAVIAVSDGYALQQLAEPSRFESDSLENIFRVLFAAMIAMSRDATAAT
jgi:AcrR family transcriptional regulator